MSTELNPAFYAEGEYEHDALPEQRLFAGVLIQAIQDGIGRGQATRLDKDVARTWFADAGDDFRSVCSFAGFEPDNVQASVLEYFKQRDAAPTLPTSRRPRRVRAARAKQSGPTMASVAAKAGVSQATVWRVFSSHPKVAAHTRRRVLLTARQLGYPTSLREAA